jgi:hypothetical protein
MAKMAMPRGTAFQPVLAGHEMSALNSASQGLNFLSRLYQLD